MQKSVDCLSIWNYFRLLSSLRFCLKASEFINVVCIDLDSFPVMVRQDADVTGSTERRAAARRTPEYAHDTEIIFIMPSLQMHLKTEHLQGQHEPQDDGMNTETCHYTFGFDLFTDNDSTDKYFPE